MPADSEQQSETGLVTAVLAVTCGRDLLGDTLMAVAGQVKTTVVTPAMPDCSAIGDVLVLNNLASDMKIAANYGQADVHEIAVLWGGGFGRAAECTRGFGAGCDADLAGRVAVIVGAVAEL
ncbi:MAG: hypothetical protein WCS20_16405 [Alphaproteobacteria bacterium]